MQETRVLVVSKTQAAELERELRDRLPPDAEWRPVPHARFSVKSLGVVATCYHSGKLVLQGRDLDAFSGRFLEGLPEPTARAANANADPDLPFDQPTIGSDEAGKGDYFGPLVVAAVFVTPGDAGWLRELGVADSKTLSDERAMRLAAAIEGRFDHSVQTLMPEEYNAQYASIGNVNVLLADMHAVAIAAVLQRRPETELALVDKFGPERRVAAALDSRAPKSPRLLQVPRAERHPAVAAASIVARAAFLAGLGRCADACGTDLHKGAGAPVDVVAKRVVAIGGRPLLAKVAKLHFKNTLKIADP